MRDAGASAPHLPELIRIPEDVVWLAATRTPCSICGSACLPLLWPSICVVLIYEEKQISSRAWLILAAVSLISWVVLWLSKDRETALLPTSLVGMLGGITALTLYSIGRYGDIRLTDRELRSGRDRFPLSDLVPGSVSGPGEPVRGKLVGGAYAPTLGTSVVGILHRDGRQLIVQIKDPEALRAKLSQALAAYEV